MSSWIYSLTNSAPWNKTTTDPNVLNNIQCAYDVLSNYMTDEACAGMLGNILWESYLNPGQGESGGGGLGLIQWTPHTALTDYIQQPWYDGNNQCYFIIDDCNNVYGTRWIPTTLYNYSFADFCSMTEVTLATSTFMTCRERPNIAQSHLLERQQFASEIYDIIQNLNPSIDDEFLVLAKHKKDVRKFI